ncbi:MAG: hypothetical protein WCR19_03300 [Acholeplasmataceae bacterium]
MRKFIKTSLYWFYGFLFVAFLIVSLLAIIWQTFYARIYEVLGILWLKDITLMLIAISSPIFFIGLIYLAFKNRSIIKK